VSQSATNETYDIAIVGSGFAGSLLAIIARRLGYSVVLIERGTHPRIVIGESTTPLTNLLLEELCDRYQLAEIRSFSKWGTWQHAHPEVACGLKRGFTFYHHSLDHPSREPDPEHARQLLVAASPHDGIADAHWYRADFDQFLMEAARRAGADYFDHVLLDRCTDCSDFARLEGMRLEDPSGEPIAFRARFVVDATGPRGFLHRSLGLTEHPVADLPPTRALYSHFTGVARLADARPQGETPPYPVDDAAVHHIFPGGWIWVLQFNNGITSAGVAATHEKSLQLGFYHDSGANNRQRLFARAWHNLLARIPALRQQFAHAEAIRPFSLIPRISFRSAKIAGRNWAQLPSAAGFVDPLLSTGFPLTLLGVQRLARILESGLDAPDRGARFAEYAAQTDAELLAAARLIAALYASTDNFAVFTPLTMLYFAAVSYSETAHRLGKPELASSFLLHNHPHFGPAMEKLLAQARTVRTPEQSAQFSEEVRNAIDPINVAGLADPGRRNWYPVVADDLRANADKLGATREDVEQLLDRCGFHAGASVSQQA
jgi:FADH2 O2-dependent halogenase